MGSAVPMAIMVVLAAAAVGKVFASEALVVTVKEKQKSTTELDNKSDKSSLDCETIVPLQDCKKDKASPYPTDGQPVYLGSDYGQGWWHYPRWDGWIDVAPKNIDYITDTEYSWAKWIWRNCTKDYVCLESAKYKDYYLYKAPNQWHGIDYSASPENDRWAWLRIDRQWNDTRGLHMYLVGERWYENHDYVGISVYIHIPPRCEGYKKILDHANLGNETEQISFTLEYGISGKAPESTTALVLSIIEEVIVSIVNVALSGRFSISWADEDAPMYYDKTTIKTMDIVKPNTHLVIWQKTASYGHYEWNSGVYFVTCTYLA